MAPSTTAYELVFDKDLHDKTRVSHQGEREAQARKSSFWSWKLATFASTSTSCLLLVRDYVDRDQHGSFRHGFRTELSTATSGIELTKLNFTGNIRFGKPGDPTARGTYLPHIPGTKQYVGDPSPEIDANWEEIIRDRYFWVSEEEAASMWPNELDILYHREGKAMLQDMIRKMLDPDYYSEAAMMLKKGRDHNLHCIDHICQYLMCTGDFTPVPTKWMDSAKQLYVDSDRPHTCRNFQNVLDWVKTREIVYRIDEP